MRKSGTRFSARIPRSAFGEDHGHDTMFMTPMSIHRNIGIEDVD
jgi:hypothetical protein